MIPASYMFKNVYYQTWEEADAPVVTRHRHRFFDGLATPLAGAISAVLGRGPKTRAHYFGGHAYE